MAEVDPRDARIAELEAQLAERDALIAQLRARLAELEAKVAELQARLGQNSSNSHKPPSSDGPGVSKPPGKKKGKRRHGGQPGHKGTRRELVPPEKVDQVVPVMPSRCEHCGGPVEARAEGPAVCRHQVWELPPIKPVITEYQLGHGFCTQCQAWTQAKLPAGVPQGAFGARLTALTSLLTGRLRLSKRLAQELLSDVLGVKVALGSVCRLERSVSAALETPYQQLLQYVREQEQAYVDETSWREARKKAWLWVAATREATVFAIHRFRSAEAAKALLGEDFVGFTVSDRWSAYEWLELELRQVCWAHLQRDFQSWVDRGGQAVPLGRKMLRQVRKLFHLYHQVTRGELETSVYLQKMERLQSRVKKLLLQARECPDRKVAGQAKAILKMEPALWTFVYVEGLEPTNNRAERAIRVAVCMRKTSYGTHSPAGSRFVERILTAVTTLKQQGRNVLEYLTAAVQALLRRQEAPSLLPLQPPAPLRLAA
jgi:transposase